MPDNPMSMVSMEIPKKKESAVDSGEPDITQPRFPWGLRIHLEKEQLDQLGVGELPPVDTKLLVYARVFVSSVSVNESQEGSDRTLQLQITDMSIHKNEPGKGAAEVLYGKG